MIFFPFSSCPDPFQAGSASHSSLALEAACDSQSPPATPFPVQSFLKHLLARLGLQPDESP